MGYRQIDGLVWAKTLAKSPSFVKKTSLRGAKGLGIRYEKELAKKIPGANHGQWFEFQDRNGIGWAQTDFFVKLEEENCILLLECKNTFVGEAYGQMEGLYVPLLERIYTLPVVGIQVCRNLRAGKGLENVKVLNSLDGAFAEALQGKRTVWHWLAGTPIWSQKRNFPLGQVAFSVA